MTTASLAAVGLVGGWAVPGAAHQGTARQVAQLVDTNGGPAGVVVLTYTASGQTIVDARVKVPAEFAGFRGLHVHSTGRCEPGAVNTQGVPTPFFTAGGHVGSALGQRHGAAGPHDGDLVPVLVTRDGSAELRLRTDRLNRSLLNDADGSAVVLHGLPDNFGHVPTRYAPVGPDETTLGTGDAGGRIACGVVR